MKPDPYNILAKCLYLDHRMNYRSVEKENLIEKKNRRDLKVYHRRGHSSASKYEKMLNFISHQENANSNHN